MNRSLPALAAAAVAATALSGIAGTAPASAAPGDRAPNVFGLTDTGGIATFRLDAPQLVQRQSEVTGLAEGDTELVGIDVRPATGQLYGLGDGGGLYTIAPRTGEATLVNELTTELEGEAFDIDFNPAVDRLRIVSDSGQNLRHDPNAPGTGTLTDTPLNTPPATPTTGIVGAAYTNNDGSADTGTILYDLNATTDALVTQTPANNGTLTAVGTVRRDLDAATGFDILSTLNGAGRTVANQGYVVTADRLLAIDTSNGAMTGVGQIDADGDVVDLAIKQQAITAG